MNGYKLVEAAKEKSGVKSDNGIATMLGIDRGNIYNWKIGRAQPDGLNSLKLAEIAGLNPSEAIRLMQSGFASVSLLIVTATVVGAAALLNQMFSQCILC